MTDAELRKLAQNSTRVSNWYAHGPGDQCGLDEATVRGPYGRWLVVRGGNSDDPVASPHADAQFAAAAMNNFELLLDRLAALESENTRLGEALKLALREIEGYTPFTTSAKLAIRVLLAGSGE